MSNTMAAYMASVNASTWAAICLNRLSNLKIITMANTPKLTNEELIDLLASGYNIHEICRMKDMKLYTLERRMENLRRKYNCRTAAQLVLHMKTVVYAPVQDNRNNG